jgi:tRNA-specific 2-thiouridylase
LGVVNEAPRNSGPKVLVAMSGGVDSSVAAALLVRAGFDVVGCFMRLGSPGEALDEPVAAEVCEARPGKRLKIGRQGCCSINDAADARLVAAELGVPLYVCNFKKDFGRIIDYFVDEYAGGRTPNPCVRCNDWLKFGKLHEYAGRLGAAAVASGHYARVEDGPDGARLMRGVDHSKDQSYVLFGVPKAQIGRMMLPIGGFEKPAVREMAARFGLPTFDKPDSQEICFVPDNDYAGLVERRRGDVVRTGAIVDEGGRVLGEHGGQHRFTVGQRKGLGVSADRALYVLRKEPPGGGGGRGGAAGGGVCGGGGELAGGAGGCWCGFG